VDNMGGLPTNQDFNKATNELVSAFEEAVIIKKWTSNGTELPAEGVTPSGIYTSVATSAVVDDIGLEKTAGQDGTFSAGDLQFQLRVPIHEPTPNPYHPGDRIVYQGIEYRLVQKAMTEYLGGLVYYTCIARRITD
jgi:hypothetical protein